MERQEIERPEQLFVERSRHCCKDRFCSFSGRISGGAYGKKHQIHGNPLQRGDVESTTRPIISWAQENQHCGRYLVAVKRVVPKRRGGRYLAAVKRVMSKRRERQDCFYVRKPWLVALFLKRYGLMIEVIRGKRAFFGTARISPSERAR